MTITGVAGCSEVTFIGKAGTGQNLVFDSPPPDPNNSTDIIKFSKNTWRGIQPTYTMGPAGGTYEVAGTYCLPKVSKKKASL